MNDWSDDDHRRLTTMSEHLHLPVMDPWVEKQGGSILHVSSLGMKALIVHRKMNLT